VYIDPNGSVAYGKIQGSIIHLVGLFFICTTPLHIVRVVFHLRVAMFAVWPRESEDISSFDAHPYSAAYALKKQIDTIESKRTS